MPERIDLITGAAAWLVVLQWLLVFATACVLLTAPTPWVWRLGTLAALALFTLIALRLSPEQRVRDKMILNLDGRVRLVEKHGETDGQMDGGAWVSPWFSVLHWTALDGGSRRHCLVCSSLNHADEYRRLVAWARLGCFSRKESLPS